MINSHGIIGQDQAIELLEQAVNQNRLAPAYLLAGAAGVGRSLVARYFIELLFSIGLDVDQKANLHKRLAAGNHPDVLWVQPTYLHQGDRLTVAQAIASGHKGKSPPMIRLEQVREITEFLSRSPLMASRKIVVLEQAETMPETAANALLKTLEEPGKATIMLMARSENSLLSTLVSRCQKIPCRRLNHQQLKTILEAKNYPEILKVPVILSLGQGSPGGAIAAWQQFQNIPPEIIEKINKLPTKPLQNLSLARDLDKALELEQQLWLLEYLQHHYWLHHYLDDQLSKQLNNSNYHSNPQLNNHAYLDYLEKAKKHLIGYVQPRLVWEVTLLKLQELQTPKVYS